MLSATGAGSGGLARKKQFPVLFFINWIFNFKNKKIKILGAKHGKSRRKMNFGVQGNLFP
jgi:hypothetical protein